MKSLEEYLLAPADAWAEKQYKDFVAEKAEALLHDPPLPYRTTIDPGERKAVVNSVRKHAKLTYMRLEKNREPAIVLRGIKPRQFELRDLAHRRRVPDRPARVIHAPDTPATFKARQRAERRAKAQHLKHILAGGVTNAIVDLFPDPAGRVVQDNEASDATTRYAKGTVSAPVEISDDDEEVDPNAMDIDEADVDEDIVDEADVVEAGVSEKQVDHAPKIGKPSRSPKDGSLDIFQFLWSSPLSASGMQMVIIDQETPHLTSGTGHSELDGRLMGRLLDVDMGEAGYHHDQPHWNSPFTVRLGPRTGEGKLVHVFGHGQPRTVEGKSVHVFGHGQTQKLPLESFPVDVRWEMPWIELIAGAEVHGNEIVLHDDQGSTTTMQADAEWRREVVSATMRRSIVGGILSERKAQPLSIYVSHGATLGVKVYMYGHKFAKGTPLHFGMPKGMKNDDKEGNLNLLQRVSYEGVKLLVEVSD